MKILSLDVENIKRVSAAFITTNGDDPLVQVTGKNGAGKSSVMDAIAMALGGKKLCPAEPLRRGQNSGHVSVDLGPYIITRRFWRREVIDCDAAHAHTPECASHFEGVDSSLSVKSPDGADYKSPQSLLDKLVSDLTFDPLGFLELQPKDQRELVRRFTGLDFTMLDGQRKTALQQLSEAETVLKLAQRDADAGEHYPAAPATAVDVQNLLDRLANAETLQAAAATAEKEVEAKRRAFETTKAAIASAEQTIEELETQLTSARSLLVQLESTRTKELAAGQAARVAWDTAKSAVPDTTKLREDLASANTVNAQVAANVRHAAILAAKQEALTHVATAKDQIAAIDARKLDALSKAAFPVPGLGFSDDGLTFEGLPFEQASYAQQLRVAVAMGLAQNPKLKVLLIRHGNALDQTSLQLLAQLATEHGAQVWLERVAEAADGVSVFIEEGRVIDSEAVPA